MAIRIGFTTPVRATQEEGSSDPPKLVIDQTVRGPKPFQKKSVVFSLHEVQPDAQAGKQAKGPLLGRAILDLAEFGDLQGSVQRMLFIATNRETAGPMGAPCLVLTIKYANKKTAGGRTPPRSSSDRDHQYAGGGGRAAGQDDDTMSYMTADEDARTEASMSMYGDDESLYMAASQEGSDRGSRETSPTSRQRDGRRSKVVISIAPLAPEDGGRAGHFRRSQTEKQRRSKSWGDPSEELEFGTGAHLAEGGRRTPGGRSERDSASPYSRTPPRSPSTEGLYGSLQSPRAALSKLQRIQLDQLRVEREERRRLELVAEKAREEKKMLMDVQEHVAHERAKLEEAAASLADALAGAAAAEEKARTLERSLKGMPGEVQDSVLAELAVYSVPAAHGGSCQKVHTPARRLARGYLYARHHDSHERAGGVACTILSAIVLAARAAGNDVARLTYWWSNTVMLREALMMACGVGLALESEVSLSVGGMAAAMAAGGRGFGAEPPPSLVLPDSFRMSSRSTPGSPSTAFAVDDEDEVVGPDAEVEKESETGGTPGGSSGGHRRTNSDPQVPGGAGSLWKHSSGTMSAIAMGVGESWGDPTSLGAALRRVEEWLHARILHMLWEQVMAPALKAPLPAKKGATVIEVKAGDVKVVRPKANSSRAASDSSLQRNSLERWKAALAECTQRLCPAREAGSECGCIPQLCKLIIEQMAARLDVAIFNALIRDADNMTPSDPVSDPITDPRALPFPNGRLSFGHGLQLKIAIAAWSDVLYQMGKAVRTLSSSLSTAKRPSRPSTPNGSGGGHQRVKSDLELDVGIEHFPLLKAMADLLMTPKEMLMDHGIRKEVCGGLGILLIQRIVYLFVPDDTAPDYVSPALLATLNAEVKLQFRTKKVDLDHVKAAAAETPYTPPPSEPLYMILGDLNAPGSEEGLVLEKGYSSDDDIRIAESPLDFLVETEHRDSKLLVKPKKLLYKPLGYKMLRESWAMRR
eukprot:jgi/Mesen1/5782/ME000293S04939